MRVHELIQRLASFEDQEAEVEIVQHSCGTGYRTTRTCKAIELYYWAKLTLSGGVNSGIPNNLGGHNEMSTNEPEVAASEGKRIKAAIEIRFDEAGNVLKTELYIYNRAPREGDTFVEEWKEYLTVKALVTYGEHGGAMLEHVVRLLRDRTPASRDAV